jgi:hypothetical protein
MSVESSSKPRVFQDKRPAYFRAGTTHLSYGINSNWDRLLNAASYYIRERGRGREEKDTFQAVIEHPTQILHIGRLISDGLQVAQQMDWADRSVNAYRAMLGRVPDTHDRWTPFGRRHKTAMNSHEYDDHNIRHQRRGERFIESMILHNFRLRHETPIGEVIPAIFLAWENHDKDQVLQIHRHKIEHRKKGEKEGIYRDYKVKAGHDIGGAVMLWINRDTWAAQSLRAPTLAEQDVRQAMYIIDHHHEPEQLKDMLNAKKKPWKTRGAPKSGNKSLLRGEDLMHLRESGQLDYTALSLSQHLEILHWEKVEGHVVQVDELIRFLTKFQGDARTTSVLARAGIKAENIPRLGEKTYSVESLLRLRKILQTEKELQRWVKHEINWQYVNVTGLDPLFEYEHIVELVAMSNNHSQLLPNVSDEERTLVNLAKETVVRADWFEMFVPPFPAFIRTETTDYAKKRPFLQMGHDGLMDMRALLLQRDSSLQDIFPDTLDDTDLFLAIAEYGPGNFSKELEPFDSDIRRLLFEFLHSALPSGTFIEKNPFIIRVTEENELMGLYVLREAGRQILGGRLDFLHKHYQDRIDTICQKALAHAGYGDGFIQNLLSTIRLDAISRYFAHAKSTNRLIEMTSAYIKKREGNAPLIARFENAVRVLQKEEQMIAFHLAKTEPPSQLDSSQPILEQQSDETQARFIAMMDRLIERRIERIRQQRKERGQRFTDRQVRALRQAAVNGLFAPSTPYTSYDSIANPDQMKTLVAVPAIQAADDFDEVGK